MADDRIILLKESDIISDSMHKINYNFQLLDNDSKVNDYRWQQYVNSINQKIEGLQNNSDSRENAIARNLESLQDLIDSMATKEDIQNQINNAIQNADEELRGFISQVVGQQIGSAIGGYATTSDIQNAISGLDYVRSSAFNSYVANAKEKTANATMMAANSTFAKENGKLVYTDGTASSFSSIEDYWNTLSAQQKAQINANYANGLNDPDVLQSFIAHCEGKFRSIHTEMALIKTSVVDGGASFDIMAAVEGENGRQIAAAIFGKANEEGSGIILMSDHVQIDGGVVGITADDILINSEHRLGLIGNVVTITSDNFVLETDGTVWGNNANFENATFQGDVTARTFATNNGKTSIGTDGILHAEGAIISGKIKANEFEAIATESIDNNGISGNLTKTTIITGNNFEILSRGELTTPNGIVNTQGNGLYIRIVDSIPNSNPDITGESVLYGVPALCMTYKGIEYILSPASWYKPGSGDADTSNMRFMPRYTALQCKFNGSTTTDQNNYCVKLNNFSLGSGLTANVYIFRPENDPHPKIGGSKYLTIGVNDTVYQFSVLNWGQNNVSDAVSMLNAATPKLVNSVSGNTVIGSYTLSSVLGENGLKFANTNGVQTKITSDNRDAMKTYLPSSDYTVGPQLSKEISEGPYNSLPTDWGMSKIATLINSLIKGNAGYATGNGIWCTNVFTNSDQMVLFRGSSSTSAGTIFNGHLPFEDSTKQSNYFYYRVDYYPLSTITNNGYIHSSGTKQIVVHYNGLIRSVYNSGIYSDRMEYQGYHPLDEGVQDYRDINFNTIDLSVDFYAVLDITSGSISNYDPSDPSTYSNVEDKVKYFLENYPFESEIYNAHVINGNDFYKYLKLEGNIYATDRVRYTDMLIKYYDRYNDTYRS